MSNSEFENSLVYSEALKRSMQSALEKNPSAYLIGQGVDDHKAIFGTTLALSSRFGASRIIEAPIAEDLITGIGLGSSLLGSYPIMTHIRFDFSLLAMNQIINLYAKYKYMFGGQFTPRGLMRLIVGRSWGQGAQHAQSLQSFFGHIPGLVVVMPSNSYDVLDFYDYAVNKCESLVIGIEHRNLYEIEFSKDLFQRSSKDNYEPWKPRIVREGNDVTIIATSIMVLESIRAAEFLEENYDVSVEVIDLSSISEIDSEVIFRSLKKTQRLLVADTSWSPYGVAAEISRLILEFDPQLLVQPLKSIGMEFTPCPTAKTLEDYFYPSVRTIVESTLSVFPARKSGQLPPGDSYRDFYRKFRGPF